MDFTTIKFHIFGALRNFSDIKLTYIAGVAVHPDFQQKGVISSVLLDELNSVPYDNIGFRTQNPAMYFSAKKALGVISHAIDGKVEIGFRDQIANLANKLAMQNVDLETGIHRGTYGRTLYDKQVQTYTKPFTDMDLQAGDSVLCVGRRKIFFDY